MKIENNTVYCAKKQYYKIKFFGKELIHTTDVFVKTSFEYDNGNLKPPTGIRFHVCDNNGDDVDYESTYAYYSRKEMLKKKIEANKWLEEKTIFNYSIKCILKTMYFINPKDHEELLPF